MGLGRQEKGTEVGESEGELDWSNVSRVGEYLCIPVREIAALNCPCAPGTLWFEEKDLWMPLRFFLFPFCFGLPYFSLRVFFELSGTPLGVLPSGVCRTVCPHLMRFCFVVCSV